MIVLVGHSGSGKDTILNLLVEELGYKRIVSYTTRPKREYEIDGIHYHFITEEQFMSMKEQGRFVESTTYRGWHYGIHEEDCNIYSSSKSVAILEPNGLQQLIRKMWGHVTVVFVDTPEEVRRQRLFKRGDDLHEISRRIASDRELFANVYKYADFIIVNDTDSIDVLRKMVIALFRNVEHLNSRLVPKRYVAADFDSVKKKLVALEHLGFPYQLEKKDTHDFWVIEVLPWK